MGQKRWGRGTSGSPELNILYRHNFHCLGENTAKNWKCFMILMEKPFQKGCAHVQSQPKWLVDSHCPLRKVRSWRSMAYVWTGVKCHGDDGSHDLLMNKCSPSTWAAFLRAPAFFLLCAINTGSLTPCFIFSVTKPLAFHVVTCFLLGQVTFSNVHLSDSRTQWSSI